MEFFTMGRKIHYGYKLPLSYNENEFFADNSKKSERLSLTFIEKGSGTLFYNDHEVLFKSPSILCLNETEVPKLITSSDFSATSIYFLPCIVNEKFNFYNIKDIHNGFSIAESQDNYLLFPFIQRDYIDYCIINLNFETAGAVTTLFYIINNALVAQSDRFWPCRCRSLLLELLILLTKFLDNNKNIYTDEIIESKEFSQNIITYLQTNYKNKITLNELAKIYSTNRTTLNEHFYLETSHSIIDYLIKYRINIASILLRNTLLPITEIMERVGFNNQTHFWRMFKKYTGISPSNYRNKYCWVD